MSFTNRRRRMFADWSIQGGICIRVTAYWILCLATMTGTLLAMNALQGGSAGEKSIGSQLVPAVIVSMIVLPLILVDLIYFSNRFAGPLVSFRRNLNRLSNGEPTDPLRFRETDMLNDLAENLNRINDRLADRRESNSNPTQDANEPEQLLV